MCRRPPPGATGGSGRMLIRRPRPRANSHFYPTWWGLGVCTHLIRRSRPRPSTNPARHGGTRGSARTRGTPIKARVQRPFPPDGTDAWGVRTYIVRRLRPNRHDLSHPNGGPVGDRLVPQANNKPVQGPGPRPPQPPSDAVPELAAIQFQPGTRRPI